MLKIDKEKIENYMYDNYITGLAEEWLRDVIDFNKINELQEFINFNLINDFPTLVEYLKDIRNQEEISQQLDLDF